MRIPRPRRFWTPRYIRNRVALWMWQQRHPNDPWLVASAIHFLDQWLRRTDLLVEFGSGRSTAWFASRVARVISVEHDKEWHGIVQRRLRDRAMTNVEYQWVDDRLDPKLPFHDNQLEHPDRYVGAAERVLAGTGGPADVILVDGCSRDHCATWALTRIKPGGLLVIDNANWYLPVKTITPNSLGPTGTPPTALWKTFVERTAAWRRAWHSNGITDTVFFFPPADWRPGG